MKLTEGLLKRTFEEIAAGYPDLETQHIIIDNCAHQLVRRPEQFDVIVTTNMNGDILSDLTSGLVGGLGFAPSANLGHDVAIFEAVHGSAPKYAGKDVANTTALILSGAMLLRYLGEAAAAARIETAVAAVYAEGTQVPRDVPGVTNPVGTRAFADAVIAKIASLPAPQADAMRPLQVPPLREITVPIGDRKTVGLDVFVESKRTAADLGAVLSGLAGGAGFRLKMISNRGTQVYTVRGTGTDCVDHWRCRFLLQEPVACDVPGASVATLLAAVEAAGLRWMHLEKLQRFDDADGFTKAQGED